MTLLKTKILDTVKNNKITMIPKWKFVLYSSLSIVGVVFTFLALIFIWSLMLFVLSRYGFMYMPFFGFMATLRALEAIPLFLFVCTILLIIIIELITRYYSFSFKRPLAITLLVLTSFCGFVSYLVSETSIHGHVRDYAFSHHFTAMARMYDRPIPFKAGKEKDIDILRGEITTLSSTATIITLFNGDMIPVYGTTSMGNYSSRVGDDVIIFGHFYDDKFTVIGIRPAPHFFPKNKMMDTKARHQPSFDHSPLP